MLADLTADFVGEGPDTYTVGLLDRTKDCPPLWQLWVDGATNRNGIGAGLVVTTPKGDEICCSVSFGFRATNNEAEY